MNLEEFVSETLVSIVQGVRDAQEKTQELGASVNPGNLMRGASSIKDNSIWDNRNNNYAQNVSFDVAVTAEDSKQGGAKVKVLSGILGGELGGGKEAKNILASRVSFTVPVLLPTADIQDPDAREAVKDNTPVEIPDTVRHF